MKTKIKLIALILSAMAIMAMFSLVAYAASNVSGEVSSSEINVGDTFTFTVSMAETTVSSIGTSVSVSDELEIVSAKWLKTGLIASFDASKNKGAFTPGSAQAMSGDIFEVTVKAKSAATSATVSVEVIAKNSTTVVFREATSKSVKVICVSHDFGNFENDGNNHSRVCKNCGFKESESHSWDAGTVTTKPTCSRKGVKTYTCEICNGTKTEDIALVAHEYGQCFSDGESGHTHSCKNCNHSESEAHKLADDLIMSSPTCTTAGEKRVKCTDCGYTTTQEMPATNQHEFSGWHKADDNEHQRVCDTCKHTEKKAHSWDAGVVKAAPTCAANGEKIFTCSVCHCTKVEILKALEHTYDNACDPTCNKCSHIRITEHKFSEKWSSDSNNHWHACSICGAKAQIVGHSPSTWIVTKEPEELKAGSRKQECIVCHRTLKTEAIPALGCKHDGATETINRKDATCLSDGHTGDIACKACGTVITPGKTIPAIAHNVEIVGKTEATCTTSGFSGDSKCKACDTVVARGTTIPALGHKETVKEYKAPTCLEEGFSGNKVCSTCAEMLEVGHTISKAEHAFENGKCTFCSAVDTNSDSTTPADTTVASTTPAETTDANITVSPDTTPNTDEGSSPVGAIILIVVLIALGATAIIVQKVSRKKQ
jgi:hypothetical protein